MRAIVRCLVGVASPGQEGVRAGVFPWGKRVGGAGSGETAKERLRLVLVHDRIGSSQEILSGLKEEMLAVISKYLEVDAGGIEVRLNTSHRQTVLAASIPVRSVRRWVNSPD